MKLQLCSQLIIGNVKNGWDSQTKGLEPVSFCYTGENTVSQNNFFLPNLMHNEL